MKALLPLLCLTMLSACLTNPSRTEYTYYQDAKLAEDYPHVLPGDSLVFLRYHQAEDKENVMDDEYAEALYFQVPDTTQFLYEGVQQLQELKVLYVLNLDQNFYLSKVRFHQDPGDRVIYPYSSK